MLKIYRLHLWNVVNWNTGNVTAMNNLFYNLKKVSELKVENWNTRKVTDMGSMFAKSGITSIDLSRWDNPALKNMQAMFNDCKSLVNINLNGFTTPNVENMSTVFSGCTEITDLDLHTFETTKATKMNSMFNGTVKLNNLDISNFTTNANPNISYMWNSCNNLSTLKADKFEFSKITDRTDGIFNSLINRNMDFKVKNATEKSWILSKYPSFTNVHE